MIIELDHLGDRENQETASTSSFSGLRAMVFDSIGPVRHEVSIPFHDSQVRGAALLIQTNWNQKWGADAYWEPGPFLADHLIFRMVRAGVKVVGVDFPVTEKSMATRLITTGKLPIVENLRGLASLPRLGFRFTATPLEPGPICSVRTFAEIT